MIDARCISLHTNSSVFETQPNRKSSFDVLEVREKSLMVIVWMISKGIEIKG